MNNRRKIVLLIIILRGQMTKKLSIWDYVDVLCTLNPTILLKVVKEKIILE